MILQGLKERLRNRFNVAVAEVDHSQLWQRSRVAFVSVASEKQPLMDLVERILEGLDENRSIQILESSTEYL